MLTKCTPAADCNLSGNTGSKIGMDAYVTVQVKELITVVISITIKITVLPEEAIDIERTIVRDLRLAGESQRAYT
jgi:hypothetical protein